MCFYGHSAHGNTRSLSSFPFITTQKNLHTYFIKELDEPNLVSINQSTWMLWHLVYKTVLAIRSRQNLCGNPEYLMDRITMNWIPIFHNVLIGRTRRHKTMRPSFLVTVTIRAWLHIMHLSTLCYEHSQR